MSHSIRSRTASAAWGALIGFGVALVGCIVFGVAIGLIAAYANPDDLSAGSAAEIGPLAIPLVSPLGAILGGVCGWIRAARRAHSAG